MQRISFAPVLSATRSRDSCWITSLLPCLRNVHVGPPVFRSAPTHGRTAAGSRSNFLRPGPSGPWKLAPLIGADQPRYPLPARPSYLAFSRTSTSRHRLVADVG